MLSLRHAVVGYRHHPVVVDVSLDLRRGEAVALLGANGSGKTTVVRGVLGLADLLSGSISVLGQPIGAGSATARIGYVPQRHTLSGSVPSTAAEVVATGLLASRGFWRTPGRRDRSRVLAALAEVGLADTARSRVSELSGGQQRRVLIARALVSDPELVILDEPTAGVDRASTESLVATLVAIKDQGRSLLVVTHDLGELGPVPDRAVTMVQGAVHSDQPCHCDPSTGCCVLIQDN